jgi:membrane protein DedA with SNARE-associated domain
MPILDHLIHFLLSSFNAHEFPALFVLLFVEADGVFLPVPGDTFIALAGSQHPPSLAYSFAVMATGILAVNLGALVLFSLMRRGGRAFIERYGRFFFLSSRRIGRLERWYQQHGDVAITLGWLIPGMRVLTAVMAGLAGVSYRRYLPYAFLGSLLWTSVVYGIGTLIYFEGPAFGSMLSHTLGSAFVIVVLFVVVDVIVYNLWHAIRQRKLFNLADMPFLDTIKSAIQQGAQVVESHAEALQQQIREQTQALVERLTTPESGQVEEPNQTFP